MKRAFAVDNSSSCSGASQESNSSIPLKKKTSSLFSIATIAETDDDVVVDHDIDGKDTTTTTTTRLMELPSSLRLMSRSSKAFSVVSNSVGSTPPLSVTEPSSDTDNDGGFYVDDDDNDDDPSPSSSSFLPSIMQLSATTVAAANREPTTTIVRATAAGADVPLAPSSVVHHHANTSSAGASSDHNAAGPPRTGLVFVSGALHVDPHNRFHKERPERITTIRQVLEKEGLLSKCCIANDDGGAGRDDADERSTVQAFLDKYEDDFLLRVHLPAYMERLNRLSSCTCGLQLDQEAAQYKSIYLTQNSIQAAKQAAASLCCLVSSVAAGERDNGFAVIRPPGHHAEPGLAGGYCLVNNVAAAAAYARSVLGMEKVLIVDWDVHHGNGTQSIFRDDPNVLYFSVHRWHGGNFFPFLPTGGPTFTGTNRAAGRNVNVGWTCKGMGDDEYATVWQLLLMPMAREFRPDLILVSAGFDAAEGDLGECNVTPQGFALLTKALMSLQKPVVCALEGGYVRSVLGRCVASVVRVLAGCDDEEPLDEDDAYLLDLMLQDYASVNLEEALDTVEPSAAKNIRSTMKAHQPYWNFLKDYNHAEKA